MWDTPTSVGSPWFSAPDSLYASGAGIRQDEASSISDNSRGNAGTRARTFPRRSVPRARPASMRSATSRGGFYVHDGGGDSAKRSVPGRSPSTESHRQLWMEGFQRRDLLVDRDIPNL